MFNMQEQPKLTRFNEYVQSKYQIYNSIFLTLPFDTINRTGVMLPLFHDSCRSGFDQQMNPKEIVEYFFRTYQENPSEEEKINLLFRFIQYIERQVVLFDAIEDAAFPIVNNMDGVGTLRNIKEMASLESKSEALKKHLEKFKIRVVLTAHPTQFYPGAVLGIITDLTEAIEKNDLLEINQILAQLGITPFFKHEKPTPYDEAVSLIWYLENVFYHSASKVYNYIQRHIFGNSPMKNEIINLGFWPGGDRDGNPFVTTQITLDVANRLRQSVLKNYYLDIRKLKRRLTFAGVEHRISALEKLLFENSVDMNSNTLPELPKLKKELKGIRRTVVKKHHSLYIDELDDLINKVYLFGYHFATLDIRQDSRVHHRVFTQLVAELVANRVIPASFKTLTFDDLSNRLLNESITFSIDLLKDEQVKKTLGSIAAIKQIQEQNGEQGANRYIISNNQSAVNVMEVYTLFRLAGFEKELPVDIIPLFETIEDLKNAGPIMEELYTHPIYKDHLKNRKKEQTIMLGFSDGTKDGGYLRANWSIYQAKEFM
jgi:phosphoenolpyruvate carboxylase